MTTEIEETLISTHDLRIGMFVCRLDRPWEGTSFPLQGIELRSDAEIRALRELCRFVYVDAHRELVDHRPQVLARNTLAASRFVGGVIHAERIKIEDEVPRAHDALLTTAEMVNRIYADVASGRELSIEYVEQAVRPLVESVLRNADAFLYVEGLRKRDNYSYSHAISCSALAAAFGRHMGLAEETIISLAAGGLLMDVGKVHLPASLLQYQGSLSAADVELVRSHVEHGLAIVAASGIVDQDVIDIVRTHHERHDGSGYPNRLIALSIPIAGRMLGIIDAYDAMTSVRPYRPAISRHHALQHIYMARNSLFQTEIVEQFQVCLGVYPTGSLVELGSGEIAVVMAQNHVRRLRPRVLVLTNRAKQAIRDFRVLDLMNPPDDEQATEIARSLAVGEFGIDTAEFFLQ